jgi:hypothetical protein
MPAIFYHLRNLPPDLYDSRRDQCFRAALPAWKKLGLGPVVDRVSGNGVLHAEDDGSQRLCVWPEGGEFVPPIGETTRIVVDDELTISWCGDKAPGPSDLDNGNPLRLRTVPMILADGEVWSVPEIREPSGSLLPTDLTRCRKTGKLLNPIKTEYLQLWEEAEYWFDLKWKALQGEAKTFSWERALKFATEILSLRYRFCDATQSALRIIDSVNVQSIIETAIGWPAVIERLKELSHDDVEDDEEAAQKKSPQSSAVSVNGSSGCEDCDHSTSQPEVSNG